MWDTAKEIKKIFTRHFKKIVPQRYAKEYGTETNTDSQAAKAMQAHFQTVFDRSDVRVDNSVLDDIDPLDIYYDVSEAFASPPSDDETRNTITR
jgi:hypothetical protein